MTDSFREAESKADADDFQTLSFPRPDFLRSFFLSFSGEDLFWRFRRLNTGVQAGIDCVRGSSDFIPLSFIRMRPLSYIYR